MVGCRTWSEAGSWTCCWSLDALWARSGKKPWGYVEAGEAAWELLEESLTEVRSDMRRRFLAGHTAAAEMVCQGIVLGLFRAELNIDDKPTCDTVLENAPDFPGEAAGWAFSTLLGLFPKDQRLSVAERFIESMPETDDAWAAGLGGGRARVVLTWARSTF